MPDTTPPSVNSVYPADGEMNISVTHTISVLFNEPVNPQTVTTASFLVSGPTGSIPGSLQVSGSYVSFKPSGYFPYSSTITVTITTAVQDSSGNALASDYAWTFTTGTAPDISAPTVPTGLTATLVTASEVDLSWDISVDNVAVAGYKIYRDGVNIQSVRGPALYIWDTGLNFNTHYCYAISAYDYSDNESAQSDPLCVTTLDFLPGNVATWGYALYPNGTSWERTIPDVVPELSDVIAIAATSNQSLALKSDGTVWIWGGTSYSSYFSIPTQVPGLSNVVAISQGGGFSLAVEADGTVWAWGANGSGQLGDGTTTSRKVPVQVTGLTNVTAVAAGDNHSMALEADGTVWAWGYNEYGQLGDGTTINKNVPVQVLRLNYVEAIAAGQITSFALQ